MASDSITALVLGILQGLTEFLPVSSSGHLVLAQHLFHFGKPPVLYDALLHLATLGAVLLVFRRTVVDMFCALPRLPAEVLRSLRFRTGEVHPDARMWVCIIVTTALTAAVGFSFESALIEAFASLRVVAVGLAVTGLLLVSTRRIRRGEITAGRMTMLQAAIIGLAQGIAIVPGISRSGTTIVVALFLGMNRSFAGTYAFIISVPAIIGAVILQSRHGLGDLGLPLWSAALGCLAAFAAGTIALHYLMKWVRSGALWYFAPYCWAVSALAFYLSTL